MSVVIRPYTAADTKTLIVLFRDAVHAINSKHYSPEQVAVWAPEQIDEKKWHKKLSEQITFVAEIDDVIVGFADMSRDGKLNHLYVHKEYQARFVSVRLLRAIEKTARALGLSKITTDCSITAKLPAERMGFKVIKEQPVERNGIVLTNYRMEKEII